jgi:hypothetical protein
LQVYNESIWFTVHGSDCRNDKIFIKSDQTKATEPQIQRLNIDVVSMELVELKVDEDQFLEINLADWGNGKRSLCLPTPTIARRS